MPLLITVPSGLLCSSKKFELMHAVAPLALHNALTVAFFQPYSAARITLGVKRLRDARTATAEDESRGLDLI
jgi:hypothetical protein